MDDKRINAYEIGSRIKSLRLSKNMTQEEFGKCISFSARSVKRFEAGDIDSLCTINIIAEKCGVDTKSILFGND